MCICSTQIGRLLLKMLGLYTHICIRKILKCGAALLGDLLELHLCLLELHLYLQSSTTATEVVSANM